MGDAFEAEARQALEVAVSKAECEASLLREEVNWLQSQLETERQQNAARLAGCADMKRKLQEAQQDLQQEKEARVYWEAEFNAKEEQYSLLEAKLAALALIEEEAAEEAAAIPGRPQASVGREGEEKALAPVLIEDAEENPRHSDRSEELRQEFEEISSRLAAVPLRDDGSYDRDLDGGTVEQCLDRLQGCGPRGFELLRAIPAEGLHTLLVAAIRRNEGSGPLLQRILRAWVCRLVNQQGSLALRTAIEQRNMEALQTLVSLGGTSAIVAATADEDSSGSRGNECVLCACAAAGDVETLHLILDHLRSGGRTIEAMKKARALAAQFGHAGTSNLLARHLVVELSMVGNNRYRGGDFEGAIDDYHEAIQLCELHCSPGSCSSSPRGLNQAANGCNVDNLVRLRYNLARAFHRADRWAEAREQATAVLGLDGEYINAYALRAQAAMASLDWAAAKEDWDRLGQLAEGCAPSPGISQEVLRAWRRRRDECCRQLAQDHYDALGLPRLSNDEEVRRAYRDLARRWHPDKHQNRPADLRDRAARRFGRIRQAYEVLGEEATKRSYDAELLLLEARPLSGGLAPWRSGQGPSFAGQCTLRGGGAPVKATS